MKKILSLSVMIFLLFLIGCKNKHTCQYINYQCECGNVSDVEVIKVINQQQEILLVKYGEKLKEFPDPINDGYSFLGWYSNDSLYDFGQPVVDKLVIVARFDKIHQVVFKDYDGEIIDRQYVKNGEQCIGPSNLKREYFEFVGWDTDLSNIQTDLIVTAIYEPLDIEFKVEYVIDEIYWYYNSKEEMVFDFLNDFYDFVNPEVSRLTFIEGYDKSIGLWINYIGGSQSSVNKLIYNNDIDADNEQYFFNSSMYKEKWYKLSNYMKNNICKNNKRFGYKDISYYYGALDFKRYILNDPATYINTYGGEEVFYGFPKNNLEIINSYKYNDGTDFSKPVSDLFVGWYLDSSFTNGPYENVTNDMVGDLKLYGKVLEKNEYTITLDFDNGIDNKIIEVLEGEEVVLPIPERAGCTFLAWETDFQRIENNFIYDYKVSLELKAKWKNNNGPNMEYLIYDNEIIRYYNTYIPVEICDTYQEKEEEFRAVWVSSFTKCFTPSTDPTLMKDELLRVLDVMESFNMNVIFFHLRTHNNAFYKTNLAPIDKNYGELSLFEEWDYLPWFIEQCHIRGIEFHAWLNPYRIALSGYSLDYTARDVASLYKDYPLNPANNPDNILMIIPNDRQSLGAILDPSKKAVQEYISNVCKELIENYDIDGIHFDDYFYARLSESNNILDDPDQDDYEKYIDQNTTLFKKDNETDKCSWRRYNVDCLIESLHYMISNINQNEHRSVEFGIAPSGVYKSGDGSVENGSNTTLSGHFDKYLFSDTVKWVKEGWIDYILPQCYTSFNYQSYSFQDITSWWNKVVDGTNVNLYIGIGAHKPLEKDYTASWKTEKDEILNQLRYLNSLENVKGVSIFSFNCLNQIISDDNIIANQGFIKVKNEYWKRKAFVPETNASKYEEK